MTGKYPQNAPAPCSYTIGIMCASIMCIDTTCVSIIYAQYIYYAHSYMYVTTNYFSRSDPAPLDITSCDFPIEKSCILQKHWIRVFSPTKEFFGGEELNRSLTSLLGVLRILLFVSVSPLFDREVDELRRIKR